MARARRVRGLNPQTGQRETFIIPFTAQEEADRDAEEAADNTARARERARERTKGHAVGLIAAQFPGFEETDLETLRWVFLAMLPAARSTEMTTAAQVYQYARTKFTEIASMDEATADAYDPSTDPGWP